MFVEAIGVRDLPDQSALRLQQQILFVTVGHAGQRQSLAGAFDDLIEGRARLRRTRHDEPTPPASTQSDGSLPPARRLTDPGRRGPAGDQVRPLLDQRLGVPAGMGENAMGDILEDHGHRQQFGRAIDDRLRARPLQAQPGVGLVDLPCVLEPGQLLSQEPTVGEFGDPDELDPSRQQDDRQ